jgi:hypothetical protein
MSSASLSSITSDSVARSTSSRNSSSLKNESSPPGEPGATALPSRTSQAGMGPRTQARNLTIDAEYSTTPAEWERPSWRGETPTITKPRTAMMPVAARPASHTLSSRL